jgi:hypothetical protein
MVTPSRGFENENEEALLREDLMPLCERKRIRGQFF